MKGRSVVHVENGPIGKTLFYFAIPVLMSQLLQELYNVAEYTYDTHWLSNQRMGS